jgi:hypothetical protein
MGITAGFAGKKHIDHAKSGSSRHQPEKTGRCQQDKSDRNLQRLGTRLMSQAMIKPQRGGSAADLHQPCRNLNSGNEIGISLL